MKKLMMLTTALGLAACATPEVRTYEALCYDAYGRPLEQKECDDGDTRGSDLDVGAIVGLVDRVADVVAGVGDAGDGGEGAGDPPSVGGEGGSGGGAGGDARGGGGDGDGADDAPVVGVEPRPEPPAGQNPGNDKPVGGAPYDGERGEVPSGKEKKD